MRRERLVTRSEVVEPERRKRRLVGLDEPLRDRLRRVRRVGELPYLAVERRRHGTRLGLPVSRVLDDGVASRCPTSTSGAFLAGTFALLLALPSVDAGIVAASTGVLHLPWVQATRWGRRGGTCSPP